MDGFRTFLTQHMGKIQSDYNCKNSSTMDIDPQPTSWNTLRPTYIDSCRNKLNDTREEAMQSPPPAGPPKILWNEKFPSSESKDTETPMDTCELTMRVQDITLQPPQPIIICENVDDVKVNIFITQTEESLTVPPVDVANEKKRPPLAAPPH